MALTLAVSSVFYALIIATGHVTGAHFKYVDGLMWSPAVAALLTCWISGQPLRSLGWGWGAWRWAALGVAIPLAYTVIAYATVWLARFGTFPDARFVADTRASLSWPQASDALVLGGYFALAASAGLAQSVASALGEEIGWRGFLTPHLARIFGFRAGAVLTGVIWAAWHMPVLVFADYNAGTPWWFAVPCFTVLLIGDSVIMAWLRLRSGSLWPAALFHASHNNFIQDVFTPATGARGAITPYAIDEFGFMLPLVVLLFAALTWRAGAWRAGAAASPPLATAPRRPRR